MLHFGFQAYGRTPAPADAVPAFGRGSPLPGGKCNDSAIFFLRSFGGSADRTYCRRAQGRTTLGPDRPRPFGGIVVLSFQGLWPLSAAPEFLASIFPRPVLGKMLVNFQILPRRSCTEARGSVQERLLPGQSLKGHFNP